MKKKRKTYKLVLVLLSIIAIVITIDTGLGWFMNIYSSKNSLPGDYSKIDYLMKSANEDMIIVGSSTAINAFIPQIIEDSLNITCFNGGCNAQFMPFFRCITENVLSRHKPKHLVLSIRPDELYYNHNGRINLLNIYYNKGNKSIDEIVEENNGYKTTFLASNLYRYNTISWRILLSKLSSVDNMGDKGYVPHSIPSIAPQLDDYRENLRRYKANRTTFNNLLAIADMCKNAEVDLIIVLTPIYSRLYDNEDDLISLKIIKEVCTEYNLRLINNSQNTLFLNSPDLFYDNNHLNYLGSKIHTEMFIEQIREN
ncbi:hypothetical protein M2138_000208 [Dysgonomonadaceae bacterium PH5-43]|nr:hypothetical protein [Dysgonomonadaceae bacterium PH5-43]